MRRHDPDLFSLLAGMAFVGLGAAFLLEEVDAWGADATQVASLSLLALGFAGLLTTLLKRATPGPPTITEPARGEVAVEHDTDRHDTVAGHPGAAADGGKPEEAGGWLPEP